MSRRMLRGLVLETRDHGERDAVVTLALREELVRVFARGVQRETSKNRRLCLPFEEVEIETEQSGTGMFRLIHGSLVAEYSRIGEDLRMQAVCLAVNEAILHAQMHPALYERLEQLWTSCEARDADWMGRAALVMTMLLRQEGISPQVDGCAICGSVSDICTMDVDNAGFLCVRHGKGRSRWPADRLRRMRHAVKVPAGQEAAVSLTGFTLEDIRFLVHWFSRYSHTSLAGERFLDSVARLYPENGSGTADPLKVPDADDTDSI